MAAAKLRTVDHLHFGPILDQGSIGACTGFATVNALNTAPLYHELRGVLTMDDAINIYSDATRIDPFPGRYPPKDTGSDGLSVAKAAKRRGWIGGYRHAFGLAHTLHALVLAPVIIGVQWHYQMQETGPDGFIRPSGVVLGGHEVALIGIDADFEYVTVLNSWGESFGQSGTAKLSFADLGYLLGNGGDATVLSLSPKGFPESEVEVAP